MLHPIITFFLLISKSNLLKNLTISYNSFLLDLYVENSIVGLNVLFMINKHAKYIYIFLISNKILLKRKKRHPRTQGVYKGEQIKNENYKSQEDPKEKKKGFSKQRTIQVRFGKREA